MAHILDRFVAHDYGKGYLFQNEIDQLSRAEMILGDNVWRLFDDEKFCEREGDIWKLHIDWEKDVPNVAPPFKTYFVGANIFPQGGFLRGNGYLSGGCLIVAREVLETQHENVIVAITQHIGDSRLALKQRGIRWLLYCIPFVLKEDWYVPPMFCHVMLVDEAGICRYGIELFDVDGIAEFCAANNQSEEAVQDAYEDIAAFTVPVAMLATCFCHCRNIEITEHLPNRKQSEKRERTRGQPLIKFRTIEIEPIRRILHTEGNIEANGAGVALHICRGHFKDYRGGKGLFGKHKDIYWWDMQARGDADLGTVLKDYQLPHTGD